MLGFGAIRYRAGAYFSRATSASDPGYQIDLLFDRADQLYTICEVRYCQSPVGVNVIEEMERKIELLPNPKGKTIERVLISKEGSSEQLASRAYFDRVITLDDFFTAHHW